MFPLCPACADTTNQGNCRQSDNERSMVVIRLVDEVRKVVEMCFVLLDGFEFWDYAVTCFDKNNNSGYFFCGVRKHVPKIETRIFRLPILGSK